MNRRRFLESLMVGAAALTLDPERLLWVPGAKRIFVPPAPKWCYVRAWYDTGSVDGIGIRKRPLTDDEFMFFVRHGTGLTYSELINPPMGVNWESLT